MLATCIGTSVEITVYECGVDCVRDTLGRVYRLLDRTSSLETWGSVTRSGDLETLVTERCECEGKRDAAPGAFLSDGIDVCRCDSCQRFANDDDACHAYVAGLNRAVGAVHFVSVFRKRCHVGLPTMGPIGPGGWHLEPVVLSERAIDKELRRIGAAAIRSTPARLGRRARPDDRLALVRVAFARARANTVPPPPRYPHGHVIAPADRARIRCACGAAATRCEHMLCSSKPGVSFFNYCDRCWITAGPLGTSPRDRAMLGSEGRGKTMADWEIVTRHDAGEGADGWSSDPIGPDNRWTSSKAALDGIDALVALGGEWVMHVAEDGMCHRVRYGVRAIGARGARITEYER